MRRFIHPRALNATRRVLLGVVGSVGLLGAGFAIYAMAASTLPAPLITSEPSARTAATSASFGFAEPGAAGVSFQCSFAHSRFRSCTSPISFPGPLRRGWHTFRVRARSTGSGELSVSATYRWQVDQRGPSVQLEFPSDGGFYDRADWNAGCARGPGVCGTASDPSGVRSVAIAIRQGAGEWWGGRSFNKARALFITAKGTTSWRYAVASQLPDGVYTLRVRASDMIGNAPTSAMTFTIVPPPPTIVAHPTDPSSSTSASFAFADTKSGVRFECRLDGGAWTACANPAVYGPLGVGEHNFSVRAVDPQGNASAVTPFAFTIAQAQNEPFTITGNIATPLYPGAGAVAIPTTLTNPNPVPIYVTAVTAAIAGNALPAGCSTSWFEIVQSSVSTTNPVQVPANGSVSLPAQGASAASIQMANPNTNQDACQGAQLAISYSGSAY